MKAGCLLPLRSCACCIHWLSECILQTRVNANETARRWVIDRGCKCSGIFYAGLGPGVPYEKLVPVASLTDCEPGAFVHKAGRQKQKLQICVLMQAMQDFNNRIKEYEKVYVPLTDGKSNRHVHFIQLVNMVTGKGHIDVNRISGYIPGKIVFFLMQVCTS